MRKLVLISVKIASGFYAMFQYCLWCWHDNCSSYRQVWSVRPGDKVYDAIKMMADKDVGSLVVLDDSKIVGIVTERHYARNVFLKGRASPRTRVDDIMERNVVCVGPDQSIEECMALMTTRRLRHLPVIEHGELLGIVSIGDLVKNIISDRELVIEQLEHYIHGSAL